MGCIYVCVCEGERWVAYMCVCVGERWVAYMCVCEGERWVAYMCVCGLPRYIVMLTEELTAAPYVVVFRQFLLSRSRLTRVLVKLRITKGKLTTVSLPLGKLTVEHL